MDGNQKIFKVEIIVPDGNDLSGYYALLGQARDLGLKIGKQREYVPRPDLKGKIPPGVAARQAQDES